MTTRESLDHLTNAELIRYTDNSPNASPLARELANRLDRALRIKKRMEADHPTLPDYDERRDYDPRPIE